MPAPLPDGRDELFDGFFFGPEVPEEHGDVGDGAGALLGHELFDGRMTRGGVGDDGLGRHCSVWRVNPYFGHRLSFFLVFSVQPYLADLAFQEGFVLRLPLPLQRPRLVHQARITHAHGERHQ